MGWPTLILFGCFISGDLTLDYSELLGGDGFEANALTDYDVDVDCPDFEIQDKADVTHFRIETNSWDATKFSYVALIVNGIEFRVDENGQTPFQVKSQNSNKKARRDGAIIFKEYALYDGVGGNDEENECLGNSDCASGGKSPIFVSF